MAQGSSELDVGLAHAVNHGIMSFCEIAHGHLNLKTDLKGGPSAEPRTRWKAVR
jgi:hypothetical protein